MVSGATPGLESMFGMIERKQGEGEEREIKLRGIARRVTFCFFQFLHCGLFMSPPKRDECVSLITYPC